MLCLDGENNSDKTQYAEGNFFQPNSTIPARAFMNGKPLQYLM